MAASTDEPRGPTTDVLPAGGMSLLDRLIRFCLENKLIVALLVVLLVGWGVLVAPLDWEVSRWPVPTDAIPDTGENQQIVFTKWMGHSPQDVEDQVTYPLTVSLLGIPSVKTVRSSSLFGFSSIYVIFEEGVDFYWSRSRLQEKLGSLPPGTLPEGVRPTMGPDATALGQVFWYTLEGRDPDGNPVGGWDLHELRSIQDWQVRYSLLSAGGISEVASVGGFVREYQVDVDPDAMRAYGVTLDQVFGAIRASNVDVGASTIEINRVEYIVRSLGFIQGASDIEDAVVAVRENVPVYVKNIAQVTLGPALRRGALDKDGAEAVGGVVVVRYGFNPLEAIENVKKRIDELAPGLPTRAVVDYKRASRAEVEGFARGAGFEAFSGAELNQAAWLEWLRAAERDRWPQWITTSQVTVVPFYDRTGLIHETIGTLETALTEEILVTIIVVVISVLHLRSSLLISAALPLAVLMCFIAMKVFGVDANIVALSGIAIAIGTIVDMSIIVCENTLRHLADADPQEPRLEVVFRATREVGGAVLTAVSTTVVSFLPVFAMTGAEGKLFKPLAFTKTFALIASVIVALAVVPPGAYLLFTKDIRSRMLRKVFFGGVAGAGLVLLLLVGWWLAGSVLALLGAYHLAADHLPRAVRKIGPWLASAVAVALVGYALTRHWEPLGPERGLLRNLVFVGALIGGLLGCFYLLRRLYVPILRLCLAHKLIFLAVPTLLVVFGAYAWVGPEFVLGPPPEDGFVTRDDFRVAGDFDKLLAAGLIEEPGDRPGTFVWSTAGKSLRRFADDLYAAEVGKPAQVFDLWLRTQPLAELAGNQWDYPDSPDEVGIARMSLLVKARWSLARDWGGRGKEFMPSLDEGSFLWMPTTMPHASIGEALDVIQKQDMAFAAIPEIEMAVGKIGRVESALDPAPVGMIETVINYKSEYVTDEAGRRSRYQYDEGRGEFVLDEGGLLIPDPKGRPKRQWRDHIRTPEDIWRKIVDAGRIPGTTSASLGQPIETRRFMLQSGIRGRMAVKIRGPDQGTIERFGLDIERLLKQMPGVDPPTVNAERIVGKPYLEIHLDRGALARYGIPIKRVQDVIEVAIGSRRVTTTVEGRERYPVRVRYMRELRDSIDTMGRVLVAAPDGTQIPLEQVAEIRYKRGPQVIKSEDTFLVGYVLFDKKPDWAEEDLVEDCKQRLLQKEDSGELVVPDGVSFSFTGTYEAGIRARQTRAVILPVAFVLIFMILYLQFKSVPTTALVFGGIFVAWGGGFLLLWLYAQPWFMRFSVFGVDMRELFQVDTINLSTAVWVGFLALFGIASDNGVVIATYLDQSFKAREPGSIGDIRDATVAGAARRIRPCLMTSATTILALIPVLTSTGRGSDVMVPMAIPSFGGMLVVIVSVFFVPVLYCQWKEWAFVGRRVFGQR